MVEENKDLDQYIADAPEPAPELEDGVVADDENTEEVEDKDSVDLEDMPDSSGNKPDDGPSKVAKIMQKLGIIKGEDKEDDAEEIPVPDEFVAFAKKEGWDDETIKTFSEELTNEELLELITELESEKAEELDEGSDGNEETKPAEASDKDKDKDKDEDDKVAKLEKKLAELSKKLEDTSKKQEKEALTAIQSAIDQMFDEAGKKFEIFGKTEELLKFPAGPRKGQFVPTSPSFKARSDVWERAKAFMSTGETLSAAMDNALTWYKGKYLEKDIHRSVLKDLKKHERKLSAKRTGKETQKQYKDEDERKADVVREAARRAGVKGNFEL